ncbi:ATPase [Rhodanobacter sp. Root179]|uniref:AAA family ATPase n=1 Tax=Rhodanobacter sp. Root179 TaxID=1736482 RepID=UPI0006F44A90|nr:ATP-binding protein [Rhodanobacter sp. Root179]KRB61616.1 ATPase [Rhodanobacter sp. Root179]
MIERLYIHNFRCLENFEFKPGGAPSVLLIGKNGSGKSTLAKALNVLQRIGRGVTRTGELVKPADCAKGRKDVPMRFSIEVRLGNCRYVYTLALELPDRFKEFRVLEESLHVDGHEIYTRHQAQVSMPPRANKNEAQFSIDWHVIALNVIQEPVFSDMLSTFRQWLAGMVLLAPVPSMMTGDSTDESLQPLADGGNFGDWIAGLLAQYPAAYNDIVSYLRDVLPDLHQFRNVPTGRDAKTLVVDFRVPPASQLELNFEVLSDGEKCFFVGAVLIAANKAYGPLLAFWDEPDSHLSMAEVRQFAMALRRAFDEGGQVIITSHNAETIRSFSNDNTWVLDRLSHLEPSSIRPLADLQVRGDLIQTLLSGELTS